MLSSYRVNREIKDKDEVNQISYELHSYDAVEEGEVGQGCKWVSVSIYSLTKRKKKGIAESDYSKDFVGSVQLPANALRYILGEN